MNGARPLSTALFNQVSSFARSYLAMRGSESLDRMVALGRLLVVG